MAQRWVLPISLKEVAKCQNYRKILLNTENKTALAAFASENIVSMGVSILDDRSFVLAGGFKEGEMVKKVSKVNVSDLTNLFSSQEEADTHYAACCPFSFNL